MVSLRILISLFCISKTVVQAAVGGISTRTSHGDLFDLKLRPLLSKNASISSTGFPPRWSEFGAPNPGTVVNVATEKDVLVTVRFCIKRNIPFLAQNGGHGWTKSFHLHRNGVLINLHGIHDVTFNSRRTEVTVQGGALISDVIAAGYASNALIETGNCNCVGTLGAILGGGFGYLMGIYGFGVDNIISLNVVTAKGNSITVTPKDVDLFWALRGTGPNFGIVTSAVMRSYPVAPDKKTAWYGPLTFKPDKIEALVQAINDLVLEPKMNIFLYYVTTGPPKYSPLIVAAPWYYGTEAEGRAAFASILELGPATDGTSILPYNHWNDGGDTFCVKGGRKPSYSAGLKHMVPHTWRAVWDQYVAFLQNNGTGSTSILLEAYSLFKARSVPDSSSSYPFRSTVNFNAIVIPWYEDPSLDTKAEAFGSKVRDLWRSTDGLPHDSTYVNFGFGDEYLSTVYGSNVHRLQALKQKYDPHGRFNQFFPLS